MTLAQNRFNEIGEYIDGAKSGQLFGKPCFKINGKAFVCFFHDDMVFKLPGESHREALGKNGAQLFDPSGKGRPMKEWVQLPFEHEQYWETYANEAAQYIKSQSK